ncbi:hypothetical protein EPN15_03350 [Patescibacteria group bacterium]|nr:MAG: hypothetical protein EPN15_03350 [Patescibacteria group bacterium]
MKKIFLGLGVFALALAFIPMFAAFEAHVINVTATIENALKVSPNPVEFGTVFPNETVYRDMTVALSESFSREDRVDDVEYKIVQKPKPKPQTQGTTDYCILEKAELYACITAQQNPPNNKSLQDAIMACYGNYDTTQCYPSMCQFLSKQPDRPQCSDGVDNDGDLAIDAQDQGCLDEAGNYHAEDGNEALPGVQPATDQGVDAPHPIAECMDGIDNDLDGNIDYSADKECAQYGDNSEFTAGDQPQVKGRLSKLENDKQDLWMLDLEVPCFIGQCKQGEVGLLPPAWEHSKFGCDLWVEVQGISETPT